MKKTRAGRGRVPLQRRAMREQATPFLRCAAWGALALAAACGTEREVGPVDQEGPYGVEIAVAPDRFWYHTGQVVELSAEVTDEEGNAVPHAEVAWSVEPGGAVEMADERGEEPAEAAFEIRSEGRVVFTGCVLGADGSETGACDALAIRADDGTPTLEIAEPEPGAELRDPEGVVVTGSVTDPDARVYVAGEHADVEDTGEFSRAIEVAPGVAHIDVVASDGLTPEATARFDVLWAPEFAETEGAEALQVPRAAGVSFGQRVFEPLAQGEADGDEIAAGNLAELVELVIGHVDAEALIPSPVVDEPEFQLEVPAADLGDPEVSLEVTESGLLVFAHLPDLAITTEGSLEFEGETLDLAGEVTAGVAAEVELEAEVGDEEPLAISAGELTAAVESAQGDFESEETAAIFELAESALRTAVEAELEAAAEDLAGEVLPELADAALSPLAEILAPQEVALDLEPLPEPIEIAIGASIEAVTGAPLSGLDVAADAEVGVASELVRGDTRGVAVLEGEPGEPRFGQGRELQGAARFFLANALAHALWRGGLFEIDPGALLPEWASDVIEEGWISGHLPPVLRAPRAGEAGAVVLELGQVELDADFGEDGSAVFAAGVSAPIDLEAGEGELALSVPEEPEFRVWTLEPAPNEVISADLLEATLVDQWGQLEGELLEAARVEIPALDLSEAIAPYAPELSGLEIRIEVDGEVDTRGGDILLEAVLEAEESEVDEPEGSGLSAAAAD